MPERFEGVAPNFLMNALVHAMTRLGLCNCWVRARPPEEQFGLRWGAHNPHCPVYRASLDPVDRKHDEEARVAGEA